MRTNFQMEYQNITMIAGDTLAFNVEVLDENGNAITVDSADMVCKKDATSSENVFHKSLGSGISQTDALMTVRVAPNDTKEVDAGRYYYAMQIGVGNDIFTLMTGVLNIEQNVAS